MVHYRTYTILQIKKYLSDHHIKTRMLW